MFKTRRQGREQAVLHQPRVPEFPAARTSAATSASRNGGRRAEPKAEAESEETKTEAEEAAAKKSLQKNRCQKDRGKENGRKEPTAEKTTRPRRKRLERRPAGRLYEEERYDRSYRDRRGPCGMRVRVAAGRARHSGAPDRDEAEENDPRARTRANFAELVCSNSLRSDRAGQTPSACSRRSCAGSASVILQCADATASRPAARWPSTATAFRAHGDRAHPQRIPNITVVERGGRREIPDGDGHHRDRPADVATRIAATPSSRYCGRTVDLHFYDAVAPHRHARESVDMDERVVRLPL